jgi:ABC-type nitrate/sulfonate/bicarbonate transport system substrate-binding protein
MFGITLRSSATLLVLCVMFLRAATAQEPISIRIGQSSLADIQVASIVTARAGFFNKYGLAPELIVLQGGPQPPGGVSIWRQSPPLPDSKTSKW